MKIEHWREVGSSREHAYSSDWVMLGAVWSDFHGDWVAENADGVRIGVYWTVDRARRALAEDLHTRLSR